MESEYELHGDRAGTFYVTETADDYEHPVVDDPQTSRVYAVVVR